MRFVSDEVDFDPCPKMALRKKYGVPNTHAPYFFKKKFILKMKNDNKQKFYSPFVSLFLFTSIIE